MALRLAATWRFVDLHATSLLADGVMGGFGVAAGLPYLHLGAGFALSARLGVDMQGGYAVHDVATSVGSSAEFASILRTAERGASLADAAWAERTCAVGVAGAGFAAQGTCTARAIFAGGRVFLALPLAYALSGRIAIELRPEIGADLGAQAFIDSVSKQAQFRFHAAPYGAVYAGIDL